MGLLPASSLTPDWGGGVNDDISVEKMVFPLSCSPRSFAPLINYIRLFRKKSAPLKKKDRLSPVSNPYARVILFSIHLHFTKIF